MLTGGSLFSGIGLLDYGLHLAGIQHRWLCEWDPWRRSILKQRFPDARVHDDVRHIGAHNAAPVDLIAGGFPCKGASTAGKQNGFDHPETVLWREMRRAVGELEPRYVLIENVANLLALHNGAVWGEVLSDLAALGFDVRWDCVPAAAVGAPHLRDRVFAVATHADGEDQRWRRGQQREPHGRPARGSLAAATDTDSDGVREQPEPERRSGRAPVAGRSGTPSSDAHGPREVAHPAPGRSRPPVGERDGAAADADSQRRRELDCSAVPGPAEQLGAAFAGGLSVEWGQYEPAIRRWEAIHGPAPQPLIRGVGDRGAAGLVKSRLSALGDGVHVQVGYLAGAYIVELEQRRLAAGGLIHAA